jgi:hypothetical protein
METQIEYEKIIQPQISKDFLDYLEMTKANPSNAHLVIDQQHGIGDIIMSLTMARRLQKRYNRKIVWHVLNHFTWLRDYIGDINFCRQVNFDSIVARKMCGISSRKEFGTNGFYDYIPLAYSKEICGVPYKEVMKSKYWLMGMHWEEWKEECYFTRDKQKERSLMNMLCLREGEEFNLISNFFKSDYSGEQQIHVNNGLRNIHMQPIMGYTLFDWCGVIERATTIHAVASSINYLIEILNVQASEIGIYIRRPDESSHDNYNFIATKPNYIWKP